ncbi:MAG TPA: hypothetical protein VM680_19535 [Verrucomicrobiae bacterium]|nr:hypothetical protein [Verrucomicrobiae bacterium]
MAFALVSVMAGPLDRWHERANYSGTNLQGIAYGAGVYVIVDGHGGRIITTRDLTKATADSVYVPGKWTDGVAFDGKRFVVVGESGAYLVSTNGFDWVFAQGAGAARRVMYGNERFVAAGTFNVAVSTNGTNWAKASLPLGTGSMDIAFGNGVFVIDNYLSSDGTTWQRANGTNRFYSIGFGNGKFVGMRIDAVGPNVLTSPDGRNWTEHGRLEILRPMGIAYGNGYFVTGGGSARAYSEDGISWTLVPTTTTDYSVRFLQGTFVATGFKTIYESDPVVQMRMMREGSLAVDGAPGATYRIEASEQLGADAVWVEERTVTLGDERNIAVFATQTNAAARFYRAVVGQ